MTREAVLDESSNLHGDQRDDLSKICEVRADGFVEKPKRNTCGRHEKTDEMSSAIRSNKFDVLNFSGRGLE